MAAILITALDGTEIVALNGANIIALQSAADPTTDDNSSTYWLLFD